MNHNWLIFCYQLVPSFCHHYKQYLSTSNNLIIWCILFLLTDTFGIYFEESAANSESHRIPYWCCSVWHAGRSILSQTSHKHKKVHHTNGNILPHIMFWLQWWRIIHYISWKVNSNHLPGSNGCCEIILFSAAGGLMLYWHSYTFVGWSLTHLHCGALESCNTTRVQCIYSTFILSSSHTTVVRISPLLFGYCIIL